MINISKLSDNYSYYDFAQQYLTNNNISSGLHITINYPLANSADKATTFNLLTKYSNALMAFCKRNLCNTDCYILIGISDFHVDHGEIGYANIPTGKKGRPQRQIWKSARYGAVYEVLPHIHILVLSPKTTETIGNMIEKHARKYFSDKYFNYYSEDLHSSGHRLNVVGYIIRQSRIIRSFIPLKNKITKIFDSNLARKKEFFRKYKMDARREAEVLFLESERGHI